MRQASSRGRDMVAIAAAAFAASPLLAGLLINMGGWRAIFAVNVPVAVAVAALLLWRVPETPRRIAHELDLGAQCFTMVALAPLTFAPIEIARSA